MKINFN